MSYLSSGYWNWLGVGRSGVTLDRAIGKDLPRQPDFDPMFHNTKCPLSLWDENRHLYMDNLRLWDCLTLIRSDPSMTCQSAIDMIFSLRDSEYLISFPDTHQLMLLRYPTGFVSHTNIDDAKLENIRLKDENSRLHAAIWVLRDNPSLQADSTVAAVFRLDENQFQAKFHADPDISGGNLFKFTDKQTYSNNNKVYVSSLDIGTQPNMAIQLTNKPIKAGLTSSRRSRSASSRRPHSRGYATLAQNALTRKRSGSSIHHNRGMSNWRSDCLLASDRMFFLPEEDIHAGLYTKRHPRVYNDNNGSNSPHRKWSADCEQEEYNATEISADYNNSQVDDFLLRERSRSEMIGKEPTGSDLRLHSLKVINIVQPKAQNVQMKIAFEKMHTNRRMNSRLRKRVQKSKQWCPLLASSRMGFPIISVEKKSKNTDQCEFDPDKQFNESKNVFLSEEKGNYSNAGELVSLCLSETNASVLRCNKNDNMRDDLPLLQDVKVIEAKEPTKSHLKAVSKSIVLDPQIALGKSGSSGIERRDLEVYKLLPKTRSDLSSECIQQFKVKDKNDPHKARPLTAKRRDFKSVRLDNLNSVAKWGAREAALKGENSVAIKEVNANESKAGIQGLSSNNNTEARRDTVIYDASVSDVVNFRGVRKSLTIISRANSKSKMVLPIRSTPSNEKHSSPEIVYSDEPAPFKIPTWQPYSFYGFTSVKYFLDRQRWLQEGEKLLKSDKTFYTRAISPTLYALNEEDYLTRRRSPPNITHIYSPPQAPDRFQISCESTKYSQPINRRLTRALPEIEKTLSTLELENALPDGEVTGCDDPVKCQDDKRLQLLYGLRNWKYTKPLATMLKLNRCAHKKKTPNAGIVLGPHKK